MSKVKLTKKQADAIEYEMAGSERALEIFTRIHLNGWRANRNQCLNELTLDELVRAVLIGYEVVPEFKIGDKLIYQYKQNNIFGEVNRDLSVRWSDNVESTKEKIEQLNDLGEVRLATESEIKEEKRRRWWSARDREVWEVYEGDIIKAKEDGLAFNVSSLNIDYLTCLSVEELDERYAVICLAENREDVGE